MVERLTSNIANNLSRIRKARGLSLDKVAELTGVSKAMISQIEKGSVNPTITVMWKIVNGLQLSFTSLLEDQAQDVSIVTREEAPLIVGANGAFRSRPLFPFDARTRTEIYWVEMDPGCVHHSEPHNDGVEEYIILEYGSLDIEIAGSIHSIRAGQSIRFNAAAEHRYINTHDGVTGYHAVMTY
jgi:Predicted transcriptional regulators